MLSEPLVRAALLCDLPIALNPATASALLIGVRRSRRGYLIFNPVSGQGDPEIELAEIRRYLEPQFMLQIWKTSPGLDPAEQARDLMERLVPSRVLFREPISPLASSPEEQPMRFQWRLGSPLD